MTHPEVPQGSDLEQLVKLLSGSGYEEKDDPGNWGDLIYTDRRYSLDHYPDGMEPHPEAEAMGLPMWYWSVTLPQGIGYNGFWCEFYFDQAGALLHHGVWE